MTWYAKLAVVLAMVLFMECFAWAAHRWIMHGFGWVWHRSHHEPHDRPVEKNDLYALVFSTIVIAMFIVGLKYEIWTWVATGITAYGAIYLFVHDMLVHQRFGMRWVPRRGYLKRLHQAHRLHHAVRDKHGAVSFGFLFAPSPARLKERLRDRTTENSR